MKDNLKQLLREIEEVRRAVHPATYLYSTVKQAAFTTACHCLALGLIIGFGTYAYDLAYTNEKRLPPPIPAGPSVIISQEYLQSLEKTL